MKLNCLGPSPTDSRDFPPPSLDAPNKYVDYRKWNRIAETQIGNSCTLNGVEGMLQVPINKLRGTDISNGSRMVDLDSQAAYNDLCLLKYNGRDNGAYPRDVMDYVLKNGIKEISPEAGEEHTIREYWKNKTIADLLNSLRTTGPQTISTEWMMSFGSCKNEGGLITVKKGDFRVGFHQTCVEGFIPMYQKEVFVVRNSHGMGFGADGYFYVTPYDLKRILVESYGGMYNADLAQLAMLAESML